ncbi:acetyl-CoA C-acetyltransferase [Salinisphaera sp.]|uniref:acetyl-CoA C-acetyltransferase n=1 Tax=Salinisphaera sp. TaxID=1914330 RepID=UPI000C5B0725|nr:acetyl-CoA C-acetyltransferase [Salinisphaera sp.]MBS61640.1 acetyl-CoA C-acyltransferase [Salinisphaera sp.]
MTDAYIVSALRTAGGRRGGRLAGWHPVDLAATLIDGLVARSKAPPDTIDDVILGCVGQVGEQAANVARNAVLASGLPESVPGTSVDRQCGSSQQALHFAAQAVMSGTMDIVIAGGVESMTRVPMGTPLTLARKADMGIYMSPGIRQRYADTELFSQFEGAEMVAAKYGIERAALDEFALESHQRAIRATQTGAFDDEILPVPVLDPETGEQVEHRVDEGIRFDATIDSIAGVKLLAENGRISAATASQICDGASGVMVVNEAGLKRLGVEPLARIHHMSVLGHDPVIMLEAPLPATHRALDRAGMTIDDIDLFEVNEAFAPIPLAWLQYTGADAERMNVNGGAIALGHPLGASGTKLMTTLVHALRARGGRYGLQTMCEGGGMANVTIIERL